MQTTHTTHLWLTVSHHRTSEGLIRYERCGCGVHRVVRPQGDDRVLALLPL